MFTDENVEVVLTYMLFIYRIRNYMFFESLMIVIDYPINDGVRSES